MKLEHCKIEQFDDETSIELDFSVPFGVSAELVTEIGRRIENFLMPLPMQIVAGPILTEYLRTTPAATALAGVFEEEEAKLEAGVTSSAAPVIVPAKRTRAPKAEAPEPAQPVAEITPAIRRTRAPAPVAAPEITDMDLAKAASGAAEVLGTQIVKDIIAEMGVKTVNEIEGFEKRQYFLDLLDAEKKLTEGEKNQ